MRALIILLFTILAPLTASSAESLTIAVSPHVDETQRRAQAEAVIRYLAAEVEPGQSALILNAYDLIPVGAFKVPDKRAYENPRAKLAVNRNVIAALMTLEPQSNRESAQIDYPVDLPGLLHYLGDTHAGGGDLIVIGSPLYDLPQEAHLSMARGGVPGDGFIRATRRTSPLGAAGEADALPGLRVHFAAIDPDWALHDRHAFAVERFITLLVEAFGAELASFSSDLETAFMQAGRSAPPRSHGFTLEETDKLEILYFRPNAAPRTAVRDMTQGPVAYTGPALVQGDVEIGLFWTCESCDLDVHVQARPGADILSYLNHQSPEGRFFKDIRSGGDDERSLEIVTLSGPVDLSALELWVNLYAGDTPGGAELELRVTIGSRTYQRALSLEAETGDGGAARGRVIEQGESDPAWLAVDLVTLLRH